MKCIFFFFLTGRFELRARRNDERSYDSCIHARTSSSLATLAQPDRSQHAPCLRNGRGGRGTESLRGGEWSGVSRRPPLRLMERTVGMGQGQSMERRRRRTECVHSLDSVPDVLFVVVNCVKFYSN